MVIFFTVNGTAALGTFIVVVIACKLIRQKMDSSIGEIKAFREFNPKPGLFIEK